LGPRARVRFGLVCFFVVTLQIAARTFLSFRFLGAINR
jgi:hypothetical protein